MPNWSLRTRFLLFALACLIPLGAVVGYYLDRSRERSIEQIIAYETTLSSQTSRSLGAFLDTNADAMGRLATLDTVVSLNKEKSENSLGEARRFRQELSGIFLVDADGNVISQSGGFDASTLLPYITSQMGPTLTQGVATVSQRIPLEADLSVVVLMVPVTTVTTTETEDTTADSDNEPADDTLPPDPTNDSPGQSTQPPGNTIGVLGAVIPIDRLVQGVMPNSRGNTEIAVVSAGQVLMSTSGIDPDATNLLPSSQAQVQLALEGEADDFRYTNPAGVDQIAFAAPVNYEFAPWAVIVTQPAPSFAEGLSTPEVIFVFALAVIVIIAMAVVLGEITAQPLRTLAAQAQDLHQGRLTRKIKPGGTGEIRTLGIRFAEMADQINSQVAVLEEAGHDRERQAAQMRDLLRRTNRMQEEERRRIAGEIHDAVTPLITGALYQSRAMQMTNGSTPEHERDEALKSINHLLERATDELHGVIFDLRPPDLDDLGVVAAIQAYVQTIQRTGLSCRLEITGDQPNLTPEVRLSIYRIVQEALHNVVRHAGADEAVVRLETSGDILRVTIRDNGAGFDPALARRPTSLGLLSMEERAESIGATFNIVSKAGGGTAIIIERANSGDVMSDEVLESMMMLGNGWKDSEHGSTPAEQTPVDQT